MQCQHQEGDTLRRQHPVSGVFSESRRGRDDKNGEEGEEGRQLIAKVTRTYFEKTCFSDKHDNELMNTYL